MSLILFLLLKVSVVLFFLISLLWNNDRPGPHHSVQLHIYPHPCWCMTEWWNDEMHSGCWNWQNGWATSWWISDAGTCLSFQFFCRWLNISNRISFPWNFSFYRSMRAGISSVLFTAVYPELTQWLAYSRHSINPVEGLNEINCSN